MNLSAKYESIGKKIFVNRHSKEKQYRCTRKKARDLFDLWFLSLKGVNSTIPILNEKLKFYNKSFSEEQFYTRIESIRSIWKSELQPFIIGNIPPFEQVLHEINQKGILRDKNGMIMN